MTRGTYDPALVVISVLIAIFASFTALDLAHSVALSSGRARRAWLAGGAIAVGVGTWAMHFVGMLAVSVPGVPIVYGIPLLALSVVVSIAASLFALSVVGRRQVSRTALFGAGLALAAAHCGMHYIGIWSMRLGARIVWDGGLVIASVAIAMLAGFASVLLAFRFRLEEDRRGFPRRAIASIIMGVAIAEMHYTAMLAMSFEPLAVQPSVDGGVVLATEGLAAAVTLVTLSILGIALAGSIMDRTLMRRVVVAERSLAQARARDVERERLLSEMSAILGSSLDYEVTLARVARLAVPAFADYCVVDLVEADGSLRHVGIAHVDPEKEEILRTTKTTTPAPGTTDYVRRLVESGEPDLVPTVTESWLDRVADSPEYRALQLTLAPRSILAIPIVTREEPYGVVWLAYAESGRRYGDIDLAFARELSQRAAVAIDNARLYEQSRQARGEAERGREELERVLESRARLIRGFSHDVKNPLSAASGYLQLLEEGILGPLNERQKETTARVQRAIGNALSLIDDILALARAEAGQLPIERTPTDIREVARETAESYRAEAVTKGLRLNVEVPEEFPLIETDPGRVRQILSNLVSNAVKYTQKGRVTVRVSLHENGGAPRPGRWAAVAVADTGLGIPEDQRRLLFREFQRLDTAAGTTGAGIGLAISQWLSRALGGMITVESEEGRGSTFTLWLPIRPEAPGERPEPVGARSAQPQ